MGEEDKKSNTDPLGCHGGSPVDGGKLTDDFEGAGSIMAPGAGAAKAHDPIDPENVPERKGDADWGIEETSEDSWGRETVLMHNPELGE